MANFRNYSTTAIHESIIAMSNDIDTIKNYYGDSNECTLESYFSAQIKGNAIYDSVDCQDESTFLFEITDELKEIFENVRNEEYTKFMSNYNEE